MRKGILIAAMLSGSLTAMSVSAQELPGIPVFGDDFSVSGLFVENWDVTKGVKCEDGRAVIPAGDSMALRRIPDGDFAITADLIVKKPEGTDIGHCGVIIDRIHFMITPAGQPFANTAYRIGGEEKSRGNSTKSIPGLEFGKPCKIMVSRVKLGDGYKYSYKVNGNPVDSFSVVMPGNGKISFYGYKTSLSVDNFQLYSIKGDGSRNLVVNSSFEHLQEGMPNYMKPMIGGKYSFDGPWEVFLKSFAIDTKEKVSGENSVRMTCGEKFPKSNGVSTHDASVVAKTPVTFSVYLKASEDDFPATLGVWELWHKNHTKDIKISKEWARYVFTVESPERGIVRGRVGFSKPGTVWADDLQIEIGSEATKYMPSSLDKDKYATNKEQIRIENDIALKKTAKAPVIDGELEDTWFKDGAKVDRFFLKDSEDTKNKTEAWLTCDDDNLYLAGPRVRARHLQGQDD